MSEQMRKEFEAWADKCGYNLKMITPLIGCESADKAIYANGQTRSAWLGWQASRAAIIVELPDWSEYDTPRQAIDACGQSLTEAGFGVSYK